MIPWSQICYITPILYIYQKYLSNIAIKQAVDCSAYKLIHVVWAAQRRGNKQLWNRFPTSIWNSDHWPNFSPLVTENGRDCTISQRFLGMSFNCLQESEWVSEWVREGGREGGGTDGGREGGGKELPLSWLNGKGDSTSFYNDTNPWLVSWTEIESHTAITNQPEESKEKR